MHTARHIQKNLLDRLSDQERNDESGHNSLWEIQGRQAHLKQFFKTAEHRKRQILEKMLMD